MSNRLTRVFLLPVLLLCTALPVAAHEVRPAIAAVTFIEGARYEIDVSLNLEALMAGIGPAHSETSDSPKAAVYDELRAMPAEALRARFNEYAPQFLAGAGAEFDGQRRVPDSVAVEVPAAGDLRVARLSHIRLGGAVPAGAREFRWAYAADFGNCIVRFPGKTPDSAAAIWLRDGVMPERYVLGVGLMPPSRWTVAWQYTALGFSHILPKGLDHILFVLGLFLLATRLAPLLWQVTAFTVAHSITLGMSMYGLWSLPPAVVEPLIAASIVYVALENLFTSRLHVWRVFIVFGFGLLHGMGFAGVLQEIGLPRSEFITGLVSFNVGVELGQLTVITLAFLAAGLWFRERPWYRSWLVRPLSGLIALIGGYWTVERLIT